jgi:hypothetical protein
VDTSPLFSVSRGRRGYSDMLLYSEANPSD